MNIKYCNGCGQEVPYPFPHNPTPMKLCTGCADKARAEFKDYGYQMFKAAMRISMKGTGVDEQAIESYWENLGKVERAEWRASAWELRHGRITL